MMIPVYMSAFTSSHPLAIRKSTSFSRKLHVWYFVLLMIYEINHIWTTEMTWKWRKWSSQWMQFMQLRKEAWKKIQDFNGVWTRDLAITGVMLYQLSYEATDVGSRSIVGSYVPVKEIISAVHIWFISFITSIWKSQVILAIWLALSSVIYSRII